MTILAMASQILLFPVLFLVASFFILFAATKTDKQALKVFGIVICILIWATSIIMLVTNIYGLVQRYPMMKQQEMQMQKPRSQQPPQKAPQRQQPPQQAPQEPQE